MKKTLVILFSLFFQGIVIGMPLNNIVVFGDSLSDTGNLYKYLQRKVPQSPPYHDGRFSNGPLWIDYLASMYFPINTKNFLEDYAFGGAGLSIEGDDDELFTLKHEIDSYFITHQERADEHSLFIVWIGSNNYLGVPDNIEKTCVDVVTSLTKDLKRLADKGAKRILVLNLPDLGRTPIAEEFGAELLTRAGQRHNELLAEQLVILKEHYPDVQWISLDIYSLLNGVLNEPERYGFSNIKDTCYDIEPPESSKQTLLQRIANIKAKSPVDPCNGYLFFDPIHPTAPAHQLIAEKLRDLLEQEGISFSSSLD